MTAQTFEVPGTPYPWQTPERNRWGTYLHPKLEEWQTVLTMVVRTLDPRKIEGPIRLETRVYVPRPPSHTGKRAQLLRGKPPLPTSRKAGDCTNHHKAIEDAMSGILYADDAQVVEMSCLLRYADGREPGAVITVSSVEPPPF